METNAMLFAVLHEQKTLDNLLRACVRSGMPSAQVDRFMWALELSSVQRIERLSAAFRGESVDYDQPFARLVGHAVI